MTRLYIQFPCCAVLGILGLTLLFAFSAGTEDSVPLFSENSAYYLVIGEQEEQARVVATGGSVDRDYGKYFTARFDNDKAGFPPTIAFRVRPPGEVSINIYKYNPGNEVPAIPEKFRGRPSETFHVVQFSGPVSRTHLEGLISAGIEFKWYLPDYAYVVKCLPELINVLRQNVEVRTVTPFYPAFKLDHRMLAFESGMLHVCLSTWNARQMAEAVRVVERNKGVVNHTSEWLMDAVIPAAVSHNPALACPDVSVMTTQILSPM